MNQSTLDRLDAIERELRLAETAFESVKRQLLAEKTQLRHSCDHVRPNGSSAWVGSFTYSSCELCFVTDF